MKTGTHLKAWKIENERVRLTYSDDTELFVSAVDFNRAFGCIVSAPKAVIMRDFAIS